MKANPSEKSVSSFITLFNKVHAELHEKIISFLSQEGYFRPEGTYLDFGCASGEFTSLLLSCLNEYSSVYGVDVSSISLMRARERHRGVQFIDGVVDARGCAEVPGFLEPAVFIWASRMLGTQPNRVRFLMNLRNALDDNGLVVLRETEYLWSYGTTILPGLEDRIKQLHKIWLNKKLGRENEECSDICSIPELGEAAGLELITEKQFSTVQTLGNLSSDDKRFMLGSFQNFSSKLISMDQFESLVGDRMLIDAIYECQKLSTFEEMSALYKEIEFSKGAKVYVFRQESGG